MVDHALLGFHAVIPAGGAGTRLWPLSRRTSPKFLHDLTGAGRSLLQATWDRLVPLTGPDGVLVVTGAPHAEAVAEQLPDLPGGNLLAEPSPRDSMAAIGLAAAVLHQRDPDAVLGSFAADHVVVDAEAFRGAVEHAVTVARAGWLVTVGVAPNHPSTAFGYIRLGERLSVPDAPGARQVAEFVEKPDEATAAAYLATGRYRWNAGMFVARAQVLLDLLAEHQPALHAGLRTIAASWDGPDRQEVLNRVWPALTKIAIDYAVAEPAAAAGRVAVVPADFGWDDVGDWASLAALLPHAGGSAPVVLGDAAQAVTVDARGGILVPAGGRVVAVLGLDDVVVVDTPDAVLVTSRARAQEVKQIVERLDSGGRADLL